MQSKIFTIASLLCLAMSPVAVGGPSCGVGFLAGPTTAVVDATVDAEWTGAGVSVIASNGVDVSPCAQPLPDLNSPTGHIRVYSKRYTRGGAQYLGMLFDVDDASPCSSAACLGDRIAILIDPNRSGGSSLEDTAGTSPAAHLATDYKFVLSNYWDFAGTTRPATFEVFKRASAAGSCGAVPWSSTAYTLNPATDGVMSFKVVNRGSGTPGYRAEVEIPLLLLGSPAGDFGISFAIINDTGAICATCFDRYSTFPGGLTLNDGDNPIDVCGQSWTVPGNWDTGYVSAPPPADVTLSHLPDFYFSVDVEAVTCAGVPNNTYYAAGPCRMAIAARPRNGGTAAQSRNILFLWGEPGMGQTVWKAIDLQSVSVPPFASAVWFTSPNVTAADLATVMGHPCVRVYILPGTLLASFPASQIRAITTDLELDAMVAAYGLGGQHVAQQNINAVASQSCPDAMCLAANRSPVLPRGVLSFAQPADRRPTRPRPPANLDAPRVTKIGEDPILRDAVFDRLAKHVIVKLTALGSPQTPTQSPSGYHFAENIGELIEAFPLASLTPGAALPIAFVLGNPTKLPLEIYLQVDMYVPPGASRPEIRLNTGPIRLRPSESTTQTGAAVVPGGPGIPASGLSPFSFGALFGGNFPSGGLDDIAATGPSFAWDLEYRIKGPLAVQLLAGQDLMCRKSPPAPADAGYLVVTHVSALLRLYIPVGTSPFKPFVSGGGGYYGYHPGPAHGGVQAGGGFLIELNPRVGFETAIRFHSTGGFSPSRGNFTTVQGGLRFRF